MYANKEQVAEYGTVRSHEKNQQNVTTINGNGWHGAVNSTTRGLAL